MSRWFTCSIALLLVIGCSSIPAVKIGSNAVPVALIHERVRANLQHVRTISGSGNITIESLEMAGSGSFQIALLKPDSVLLKLEGPFGIDVGAALITRTDFLFYNSMQNQLISGSTSPANLSRFLRINVTFDDLLNLFAGSSFFAEDEGATDDLTTEENHYVLIYHQADRTRRYWIDPEKLLIKRIQHLDARGKLIAEQQYTNYRSVGDVFFPSNIRLIHQADRRVLSIHYSTVEVNTAPPSFTLDIPGNARRIRVQ